VREAVTLLLLARHEEVTNRNTRIEMVGITARCCVAAAAFVIITTIVIFTFSDYFRLSPYATTLPYYAAATPADTMPPAAFDLRRFSMLMPDIFFAFDAAAFFISPRLLML